MAAALPIAISIIVCDSVYVDTGNGKRSFLGCFAAIGVRSFPSVHPQMHVHVELTSGHGPTPLKLKLVRATADLVDGEEIADVEFAADFTDPRAVLAFGVDFRNTEFREPGEYRAVIESQGIVLLERRFVVAQIGGRS